MAARTGPRKIHRYTAEFKLTAVKLTQIEGIQVKDVAESLDIHPLMCRGGARKYEMVLSKPGYR